MTGHQIFLAEYVRTGSDDAFRELVARYVDLVYSTALRLVEGDAHRAEDVAQTVFVDLARLARTLSNDVMLGGWLHRHTCFVAANTMRGERRRQSRERQAVEMNALHNDSAADFSLVAPILDKAINELGDADRTAMLLRFFEQHDFRAVAEALGSTEDAVRMRVTRALDKLEDLLKRRGVTTSAATLSVALSVNTIQAAPVGLAISISTAAALAGTTLGTAATATKAIAMTTLQKTIIGATLAVAVGTIILEAQRVSYLHARAKMLLQQQSTLAGEIQELTEKNARLSNQLVLSKASSPSGDQSAELLRLRGEVTRLWGGTKQTQTNSWIRLNPVTPSLAAFVAAGIATQKKEWQEEALGQLAGVKEKVKLTAEQEEAIRNLMMKRVEIRYELYTSGSAATNVLSTEERAEKQKVIRTIEPEIRSLLTTDQQAAYVDYQKELAVARGRTAASVELARLQDTFNLTVEQQDKLYPTLYELAVNQIGDNLLNPSQSYNAEIVRRIEQSTNALSHKLAILGGILSESQVEQIARYRKSQERQIDMLQRSLSVGE